MTLSFALRGSVGGAEAMLTRHRVHAFAFTQCNPLALVNNSLLLASEDGFKREARHLR